jgi:hypothetical protein
VGEGVRLGNGDGTKAVEVGKGVNVGNGKLNRGVGVASIATVGTMPGLGVTGAGLRDRAESKPTGSQQRQQKKSTASPGRMILPSCPCWLYVVFNAERNVLICFIRSSIITCEVLP